MQTTLLSLAIALIAALLTALLGPAVVDWDRYRGAIEAQAAALVGANVRVGGTIDVRLLPTPSVALGDVRIGPSGDPARQVAARGVAVELSLGALMRGDIRAEVTLERPEAQVSRPAGGALTMPGLSGVDPGRVALDRLRITGGRLRLEDDASGAALVLEDVNASGEAASLSGPFRLEGTLASDGAPYAFRLSGGRRGDDGGLKVRLAVDAPRRAARFETDGTAFIDGGLRYQGNAALSQAAGAAGGAANDDPWRVSGAISLAGDAVRVDDLETVYGPPSREVRLHGLATMDLRREGAIAATLNGRQVDTDRLLAGGAKRPPLAAALELARRLAAAAPPPVPLRLSVGVDSLIAGGGSVAALQGEVAFDAGGVSVERLDLRAPGATRITAAGHLARAEASFRGPVGLDSGDPSAFLAWLEGASAAAASTAPPVLGPVRVKGILSAGAHDILVEGLTAEAAGRVVAGRAAYRFAAADAPARLEGELSAAELDLDHGLALAGELARSPAARFEWPAQVALAVSAARAAYAGVEGRDARAVLRYDPSGLTIERLSLGDLAGAAVDASGRLEPAASGWRGGLEVSLSAPQVGGLTQLADRFVPAASAVLRRRGPLMAPLNLAGRVDVEPAPDGAPTPAAARLKLGGSMAGIALAIEASAAGDVLDPLAAQIVAGGRLEAQDGRALAALAGLDALAEVGAAPARMTLAADGAAGGAFRVDGRFKGEGLDALARGTLSAAGAGDLDVTFRARGARLPLAGTGPLAADVRARLSIDGAGIAAREVSGRVAGASVTGSVIAAAGAPVRVDGRIEAAQADAGELFAVLTGAPRPQGEGADFSAEPFGSPPAASLEGRVEFRAGAARWLPGAPVARDVTGLVAFDSSGFALRRVSGRMAEGRLALDGEVGFERAGPSLHARLSLAEADLPLLLAGALHVPASGRLSLRADLQAQGLSPASLAGSLTGSGTLQARNLEVAGLAPGAVESVLRALAADRRLAGAAERVAQIASAGLDAGRLRVAALSAPIAVNDGRAEVTGMTAAARNTDVTATLSVGLIGREVNARIAMTAPPRRNAPERPVMAVTVSGPLSAARRTVDVTDLVNWATMRAIDEDARRLDEAQKARRLDEARERALQHEDADAAPRGDGAAQTQNDTRYGDTRYGNADAGHVETGPADGAPAATGNADAGHVETPVRRRRRSSRAGLPRGQGTAVQGTAVQGTAVQGTAIFGGAAASAPAQSAGAGVDRRSRPGGPALVIPGP